MFDFFFPKILETRTSKYCGEIKVVKQFGNTAIWSGGFEQSGKLVEGLWKSSFVRGGPTKLILIMGLGSGAIMKCIDERIKVVGVEIDQVMVDLGQKYFGLNDYKNLKIKCVDANEFKTKIKFDLIIWDLYLGGKANINSIGRLVNFMTIDGEIIFNQLCFGKDQIDLESVIVNMGLYDIKKIIKSEYNKLIFCSRKKA